MSLSNAIASLCMPEASVGYKGTDFQPDSKKEAMYGEIFSHCIIIPV
jgi:hypothetical protein